MSYDMYDLAGIILNSFIGR